jgi:hypothetical protein
MCSSVLLIIIKNLFGCKVSMHGIYDDTYNILQGALMGMLCGLAGELISFLVN